MPAPKELPENAQPINRAALRWLRQAKAPADPDRLYALQLLTWGYEMGIEAPSPIAASHRQELMDSAHRLLGPRIDQTKAMAFLLSNPAGDERDVQEATLLELLETAESPEDAAAEMMAWHADLMQASDPYYQPAASQAE